MKTLTKEDLAPLLKFSDEKGFQAVLFTWSVIFLSIYLSARYPHPLVIFIAWILIGGRQLALAILMHDCSHYSLFKTKSLNDFIGKWIVGYPVWQDLLRYRPHHWLHHRHAGTKLDPDLDLVEPFPISRKSFARKMFRDLSGISGIKRIYGHLLMDLGFIEFTVSSKFVPIPREKRNLKNFLNNIWVHLKGVVITNLVLYYLFSSIGAWWSYPLWVFSFLTSFSVIVRIRSNAEHACTSLVQDPRLNSRCTFANIVERMTFAPHRVNYHLEHHYQMQVPYFHLPDLHNLLKEKGLLAEANVVDNYLEVLRIATSRRDSCPVNTGKS